MSDQISKTISRRTFVGAAASTAFAFNVVPGRVMEQWRNYKAEGIKPQWQVIDETMVLTAKGARDLVTKKHFRHFDLRQWVPPRIIRISPNM